MSRQALCYCVDDVLPERRTNVTSLRPDLRTSAQAKTAGDQVERLAAYALDWVTASVPASVVLYSPVDRRLNLLTLSPIVVKTTPQAAGVDLERLQREYVATARPFDPFAPARWNEHATTVASAVDVGGSQALSRSSFGEFLARHGLTHQASMFLRDRGRISAVVVLLHLRGEADLTSADLTLLRRCQPFLELALSLGRARRAQPEPLDLLRDRGLTAREVEVALLASSGSTNSEIACALHITLSTVKTHMTRVMTKLGVRSRTELVMLLHESREAR